MNAGNVDGSFFYTAVENLTGGTGEDTLDLGGYTGPVTINLETSTVSGLSGNFSGFENFNGSASIDDTLVGFNSGSTFNITALNAFNIDELYYFTNVENITGGTGVDNFVFEDAGQMSGDVDGGAGSDTLDYSNLSTTATVNLTAPSGTDGFNGTATGISGNFGHINAILGSGNIGDSLNGADRAADWMLDSSHNYVDVLMSNTLSFAEFEELIGGSVADRFVFADGVTFNGNIDGAAGVDTFDFNASTSQVSITLTGLGSVDGYAGAGTGLSGSFDNIDELDSTTGGTAADQLTGADLDTNWELDGSDRLSDDTQSAHDLEFAGFAILVGGSMVDVFTISTNRSYTLLGGDGSDRFEFVGNAVLTGSVDGQSGANDQLDFSSYATARNVTILDADANGYTGTEASLSLGFSGIDRLIGSPATGLGGDRLNGYVLLNDTQWNDWVLNGADSSYQISWATTALTFDAFDVLYGGNFADYVRIIADTDARVFGNPGDDIFYMEGNTTLTGALDGGGGTNTLDYSGYDSGITIDLPNNQADHIIKSIGIPGSIEGIQNITGSNYDDVLIGNNGDNVLTGNGGNDWMAGGDANDTYVFVGDTFGNDTVQGVQTDAAGLADTFDFSGATRALTFDLPNFFIEDGVNSVTYNANVIEHFIGGLQSDQFLFTGDYTLPENEAGTIVGTLNGGGSDDTIDYSLYASGVTVNLMTGTATATAGISLIEDAIGSAFNDVLIGSDVDNRLVGNAGNDQLTGNGGNDELLGGVGNDSYFFAGDVWGQDTLLDLSGDDTLDFYGATTNLNFHINLLNLVIEDGLNTLTVSNNTIENLLGGTGDDSFIFEDGATVAGGGLGTYIDGGPAGNSGNNTLDYTLYTTDVLVNLATRYATGVNDGLAGGIDRIDNVIGGSSFNEIWGDNSDNVLESGSTNDILYGMGGNDTYVFYDDWGIDVIDESPANFGGGIDTVDFSNVTIAGSGTLVFTFDGTAISVIDSVPGARLDTFNYIGNFIGGPDDDHFVFTNYTTLNNGIIDGNGGY
ncbi:MAG: hypothetical protein K8R91_04445, partial [Phycisphaerae bacterium]|nr:hypothetical protein [Phycisphaerae bacterium]